MRRQTRSILDELTNIGSSRDSNLIMESRANHIINSAINLIQMIKESFPDEDADELERRLINSIRGKDPNKFVRGLRRMRDEE